MFSTLYNSLPISYLKNRAIIRLYSNGCYEVVALLKDIHKAGLENNSINKDNDPIVVCIGRVLILVAAVSAKFSIYFFAFSILI